MMKATEDQASSAWSVAGISPYLTAGLTWHLELRYEVGSTNDEARLAAQRGAAEGFVCLAHKQTAGRGRRGRSFFSPGSSGLYLSLLLRPTYRLELDDAVQITVLAAAAAASVISQESGQEVGIKWVNDLMMAGRKVGGILTEGELSLETRRLDAVILGLGINLSPPAAGWPDDIRESAGSVWPDGVLTAEQINRLTGSLLNTIGEYYLALPQRGYLEEYRARSVLTNRQVEVHQGNEVWNGRVLGIDDDAALRLQREDGAVVLVNAGEVCIRPEAENLT